MPRSVEAKWRPAEDASTQKEEDCKHLKDRLGCGALDLGRAAEEGREEASLGPGARRLRRIASSSNNNNERRKK